MLFEGLPTSPTPGSTRIVPPEARGAVGARAALYGVGTKQDGDDVPAPSGQRESTLCPMPAADASWPPADVQAIVKASGRAAAIGELRLANLWRRNLGRPKSVYADVQAVLRMLDSMERAHAGRSRALPPVEPDVRYDSLAAVPLAGAAYPSSVVPDTLARAVLPVLNQWHLEIARAGFRNPADVHAANASREILAIKASISATRGAIVRIINQIGHLQSASRLGQTAENPMTLGRRRGLVASALAQLAEDIGVAPWTPESLGLITEAVRARWSARDAAMPLRAPRYRDLFAWSDRDRPNPAFLDGPEIDRLIQSHPDPEYVECLRRERSGRFAPSSPAY